MVKLYHRYGIAFGDRVSGHFVAQARRVPSLTKDIDGIVKRTGGGVAGASDMRAQVERLVDEDERYCEAMTDVVSNP